MLWRKRVPELVFPVIQLDFQLQGLKNKWPWGKNAGTKKWSYHLPHVCMWSFQSGGAKSKLLLQLELVFYHRHSQVMS